MVCTPFRRHKRFREILLYSFDPGSAGIHGVWGGITHLRTPVSSLVSARFWHRFNSRLVVGPLATGEPRLRSLNDALPPELAVAKRIMPSRRLCRTDDLQSDGVGLRWPRREDK